MENSLGPVPISRHPVVLSPAGPAERLVFLICGLRGLTPKVTMFNPQVSRRPGGVPRPDFITESDGPAAPDDRKLGLSVDT